MFNNIYQLLLNLFILFHYYVCGQRNDLFFKPDGTFQILQLTDLHFGQQEKWDQKNMEIMQNLILNTKPDFTVITGDVVSDYTWDGTPDYFERCWAKFKSVFEKLQQPYAYILGNHDIGTSLKSRQIVELDQTCPYSYTRESNPKVSGATNFFIQIHLPKTLDETNHYRKFINHKSSLRQNHSETENKKQVAAILWGLDSHSLGCEGKSPVSWGCVEKDQVRWFKKRAKDINQENGQNPFSMIFLHIPTPQYLDLFNTFPIDGTAQDVVSCPIQNTGLIDAAIEFDVNSIVCGHDHNNDFRGTFVKDKNNSIELFFGRKTGYGGYGPEFQRGARIYNLKLEENTLANNPNEVYKVVMESEIIQEDGSFVLSGERQKQNINYYHCGFSDEIDQHRVYYWVFSLITISILINIRCFKYLKKWVQLQVGQNNDQDIV